MEEGGEEEEGASSAAGYWGDDGYWYEYTDSAIEAVVGAAEEEGDVLDVLEQDDEHHYADDDDDDDDDVSDLASHERPRLPGWLVKAKIGSGAFGSVWRCVSEFDPSLETAVKWVQADGMEGMAMTTAKKEVQMIRQIGAHPNIVALLDVVERPSEYFLVLEMLHGGCLLNLAQQKEYGYSEDTARLIMQQSCRALLHLHEARIAHCDIKTDNIMIRSPPPAPLHVVLIDFGFATVCDLDNPKKVLCGTPEFQSPEIVAATPCDARTVDMWALGVVGYMALTGEAPFTGKNRMALMGAIRKAQQPSFEHQAWDRLSPHSRELIASLVCPLEKRFTAAEALKHPWLQDEERVSHEPLEGLSDKARQLERTLASRKRFRAVATAIMARNALLAKLASLGKVVAHEVVHEEVAVVTGGSRGIGRAMVERLVRENRFKAVIFTSRNPEYEAIDGAEHYGVDFEDLNSVGSFAEAVLNKYGRVDVLVNNAGIFPNQDGPFASTTSSEAEQAMRVNTLAPMILMQRFVAGMEERKHGFVLNMSSTQGSFYYMREQNLSYRLSKVALNCLTRVASAEYPHVCINSVCPGFVDTDMAAREKQKPGIPAPIAPAQVAEDVIWLLQSGAPSGGFFRGRTPLPW